MITAPGPTLWAQLPAGGWQVGFWVDDDGRTLVDVADSWGTLAYRVAAARRAAPSIDAGWAGCARGPGCTDGPDGDSQCWALAVGHAPPGLGYMVSFAGPGCEPDRGSGPRRGETLLRVVDGGLWVAAAVGSYTHVQLTAPSVCLRYPLCGVAG